MRSVLFADRQHGIAFVLPIRYIKTDQVGRPYPEGFEQKWSKRVYQVMKQTALRRNPMVKRYSIGAERTFLRHELLKIPKKVDKEVLTFPTSAPYGIYDNYEP